VRPLGHLALAEHHLNHAGRVTQVDEDHPAVIAASGHPTGERDGLLGVVGPELAGLVGAHHGVGSPRKNGAGVISAGYPPPVPTADRVLQSGYVLCLNEPLG